MAEADQHPSGDGAPARAAGVTSGTSVAQAARGVPGKRRGHVLKRIFGGILIGGLALVLLGAGAVGFAYVRTDIPDPNADFQTNNSTIFFADGEAEMGNFQVQNRESVPFDEIPQSMKDAAIAAENRTFWTDPGYSVTGMARAALAILGGGDVQGGSTITQQYIKILYLSPEQTLQRKFTELLLAHKLNTEVSKEEILSGYLNTIYFGRGAYGVQAAAQAYFGVDAADLSVEQSAALAAILNSPANNDPAEGDSQESRLFDRYRYVLDGMVEIGALSSAEEQQMAASLPEFPEIERDERFGGPTGHLLKMVQDELLAEGFDESQIQGGGLQVTTTIDQRSQEAIVEAAQSATAEAVANNPADPEGDDLHAAMASVDTESGGIRALYGGPDYVDSQFNWATTPRPTGSTFKAFALAAGLEDGYRLLDQFEGNEYLPEGAPEPVRNQAGARYGSVNMITATAQSVNTAFVDLTMAMNPNGPQKVIDAAERAGVPPRDSQDWNPEPNISLGIAEASPVAMAGAYATFANDGVQVAPHIVAQVTDANGRVLYENENEGTRAFESDVNADVTYALTQVVENGSGRSVQSLGRPVAGKTGTHGVDNAVLSSWFIGMTPQVATSVMFVAGEEGQDDLGPYSRPGDRTFFGGSYPTQAWTDYMQVATEGMPVESFPDPAYVDNEKTDGTVEPRAPQNPAPGADAPADSNGDQGQPQDSDDSGQGSSPDGGDSSDDGSDDGNDTAEPPTDQDGIGGDDLGPDPDQGSGDDDSDPSDGSDDSGGSGSGNGSGGSDDSGGSDGGTGSGDGSGGSDDSGGSDGGSGGSDDSGGSDGGSGGSGGSDDSGGSDGGSGGSGSSGDGSSNDNNSDD